MLRLQVSLSSFIVTNVDPIHDLVDRRNLFNELYGWLREEVFAVEDENFRDKIKELIITNSVRPGERTLYTCHSKGVQASDELSVLERTRTAMQTFWLSFTYFKKYRTSEFVRRIELLEFIEIMAKSKCQFDWKKTCLQLSHEILLNIEGTILNPHPIVMNVMKYYIVIFRENMIITASIEEAFLLWCYYMKGINNLWEDNDKTFNMSEMVIPIFKRFLSRQSTTTAVPSKFEGTHSNNKPLII